MRLSLIVVAGCSTLVGGCVAPLIAGLAAGGGVLGVGEGTDALARRAQSGDDRLKHITAASLGVSSADIATDAGDASVVFHSALRRSPGIAR